MPIFFLVATLVKTKEACNETFLFISNPYLIAIALGYFVDAICTVVIFICLFAANLIYEE